MTSVRLNIFRGSENGDLTVECVSVFMPLRQAYLAECERQGRKLLDEANKTAEVIGASDPLVLKAQAVAEKAIERNNGEVG